MDELVKLMDELSLALQARVNAGIKTAALAEEVRNIPKLSVIAPHLNENQPENAEHVLSQLQLRMELQNLLHAKEEALETINQTVSAVALIRSSINEFQSYSGKKIASILEDYDARIQDERLAYAELQQRKQDLLFRLNQKLATLQRLTNI